jgi:hypothetical protein
MRYSKLCHPCDKVSFWRITMDEVVKAKVEKLFNQLQIIR